MLRAAVFWSGLALATAALGTLAILVGALDRRGRLVQPVSRLWARACLRLAGARATLAAPGGLPERAVYVANHQSAVDIFALGAVLPGQLRWVAKRELFRIPIFGRAMRAAGYVAVDREDPRRSRAGLAHAAAALEGGASLVVFPEGTRSPDGRLRAFKRGAFALAQAAGVPVVPLAIHGSRDVLGRAGWRPRPGAVRVVAGAPIPSADLPQAELVARAERAVSALLEPASSPAAPVPAGA